MRLIKIALATMIIAANAYTMQSCCIMGCYPVVHKTVAADQKLVLQHNYMAIMAKYNSEVDIEVSYAVLDGNTNKTIVKKLKTPCLIGGEDVMIHYDIREATKNNEHLYTYCDVKKDDFYKQAGDITVKNLSNKPLEYAFINNVKIYFLTKEDALGYDIKNIEIIKDLNKVFDKYDNSRVGPIYKGTPLLYLIKPELAPNAICYVINAPAGEGAVIIIAKEITLKEPNFGEITITKPYSIEQIIDIYRDKPNELFENYRHQYLGKNMANNCKINLYYGTIKENDSYVNTNTMMWINIDTSRGRNGCIKE